MVEGAVAHDGVVWVCEMLCDGSSDVRHRACPSCHLELVERHVPDSVSDTATVMDGGETVDVLVCPHCAYEVRGQKHETAGADAALSVFDDAVEGMRRDGGMGRWERVAESAIGSDPTPADVWDEYTRMTDREELRRRTVGQFDPDDRRVPDTYPAFAELKQQRSLRESLVEWLPDPLDVAAAEVVRTDYLERKETLKRKRTEAREKYDRRRDRIRDEHRDTLAALTRVRADRVWPDDHSTVDFDRLADDVEALRAVRSEYNRFLTGAEYENANRLASQFEAGLSYYQRTERLQSQLEPAREAVEAFESEFDPYSGCDTYLETGTEERLRTLLSEAESAIETVHETVDTAAGPVPTDVPTRIDDWQTLVEKRRTTLDRYESLLVDHETEMYPDVFETEYGPLNEKQTLAVVRNDSYNLVDASAGTGKTLTLTRRFLYLYRKGTPLDDIAAITFTSDAAEEMRTRITDDIGHLDPGRLNVMTTHALARRICSRAMVGDNDTARLQNGQEAFLDRAFSGENDFERIAPDAMEMFQQHRRVLPKTDENDLTSAKNTDPREGADERIRSVFQTARNFGRTSEEIRDRTDRGDTLEYHAAHAVAALLDVYTAVGEERDHPIDHDHSIERATEIVRSFPDRYEGRFDHLLVDEFQDVSQRELDFVEALLGPDSHLFAVGDDWQSIYGFRGSKPAFFREFESRFEPSTRTTLEVNYRCPPEVARAGTDVMLDSAEATTKEVRADSGVETTPVLHRLRGPYTDRFGAYIADRIEEFVDDGAEYGDTMVVTRTHDRRRIVQSHLESRSIPVEGRDDAAEETSSVTVLTVHGAKGTEAPYVVVANAVDDRHGGMPSDEKEKRGEGPIRDGTIDHYEEERRLLYVALTRAETELHVVARADAVSRYVDSIGPLDTVDDTVTTIEGKVTELNESGSRNGPEKLRVDCGSYDAHLSAWESDLVADIDEGGIYRFDRLDYQPNRYDEDMEITEESRVRRVG